MCIKLELIKELYYDARPNKSQDDNVYLRLMINIHGNTKVLVFTWMELAFLGQLEVMGGQKTY